MQQTSANLILYILLVKLSCNGRQTMSTIHIKQAKPADYSGILRLQSANRLEQLSEEEKKQGFIASNFTSEALDTINKALGILIAVSDDEVVGFVCMCPPEELSNHPVIQTMLSIFRQRQFNGKPLNQQRIFIYGPVCIDKKRRGQGILKKLFAGVNDFVQLHYDAGVAFINANNPHSLSAHVDGLKMTALTPFDCDGERYQLIAFAPDKSITYAC